MRVLNVNSTLGLRTGGGTSERTFQMSRHLAMCNVKAVVLTLDIELDDARRHAIEPASVVALPCLWKRFYVPRNGWRTIKKLVNDADVIHLMGHWGVLNILVYLAARRANKPYAVCPAGALPIFGRSALIKRFYNMLVGKAIVRNAVAWIAVTEAEFPQFRSYGVPASKIVVIPNGVNEEDFPATNRQAFLHRFDLPDVPFILSMGRLNPIKGPDILLQAYIQARMSFPAHHLVFAGPDGGMLEGLRRSAAEAGVSNRVHFIGYVNGEDKSAAYRHAQLLVVPSRQEAMSIVALEAGICGTPVLLTDQCGFSEVLEIDARMEVPATIDGIAYGLTSLLADDSVLNQISPVWKEFVERRYAWRNVVEEYLTLYRKVLFLSVRK